MIHIEDCLKHNKMINVINIPNGWTPYNLIKHYIELYNILDEAKKHPEPILKDWLGNAKKRSFSDFTTSKEIEILEEITQ